jgi:hypothetical protein
MIRSFKEEDRTSIDVLMKKLQKYFASIDSAKESLAFNSVEDAHRYMQKMLNTRFRKRLGYRTPTEVFEARW